MKEFIFGERNGIYIIDLQKTQRMFKEAIKFVTELMSQHSGRTLLFVGTKRQAQDAIRDEAHRCGQFYINQRWLGGLLTNFQTIQKSIKRLKDIDAMQADGRIEQFAKKERLQIERERLALEKNLSGIKDLKRLPDVIFVIDTNKEEIAVKEANRLGIPVVAVVDTNCDPNGVNYVIPGNDDALRAVRLFASRIADAVLEGQQLAQQKESEEAAIAAEQLAASGGVADPSARPRRDRGERGERGERRERRGERGDRGPRPERRRPTIAVPTAVKESPAIVEGGSAEPATAPDSTPDSVPVSTNDEGVSPVEAPVASSNAAETTV
jgi:small subunit ribosomal protein S2